ADVLSVADEVRRVEGRRGASAEGVGAGERPAEADHRRAGVGHLDAEGSDQGKILTPARRRDAVVHLVAKFEVSERRACRLLEQHRSTQRYVAEPADFELKLVARMTEVATDHPRWGYRMVHAALVEEGWLVNRKRVERLWRSEGLDQPPAVGPPSVRVELAGWPPRGSLNWSTSDGGSGSHSLPSSLLASRARSARSNAAGVIMPSPRCGRSLLYSS